MREKVIRAFVDKETKKPYNTGYIYESDDKKRIEELKEKGFLYGGPVEDEGTEPEELGEDAKTEESKERKESKDESGDDKKEYPYHKGGGNYELSNGENVRGKKEAIEAQEELDKKG